MSELPRVTVFGTGAMACFIGGRLARSGCAVTLVGTWADALSAIAARGIVAEGPQGSWTAPAAAARLGELLPPADVVLVLVKSWQTEAIAPFAAAAVRPGGLLVTLQNGLGNREALEQTAGAGRVRQGVTVAGATLLGPAVVRGFPGQIFLDDGADLSIEGLIGMLWDAGFEAHAVPDIDRHLWRKLAVNCAINPLSALLGVTNGALLAEPEPHASLVAAAREAGALALARGLALDPDEAAAAAVSVARATAGNRSSMLQDLERGARTEIEALSGAVVREGRLTAVATPVNEALYEAVRAREAAAAGA